MNWMLSYRCDPATRRIADRHYNRQSVGADNFVPPGRCLVLRTEDVGAFWVTSWPFAEYVRHRWGGAWVCSAFRRESGPLATTLIIEAIAATRWRWPEVPALGMVTFLDTAKVKPTRVRGRDVWGWTWMKVGFKPDGQTEGGLLAFRLAPEDMPPAAAPRGTTRDMWEAA